MATRFFTTSLAVLALSGAAQAQTTIHLSVSRPPACVWSLTDESGIEQNSASLQAAIDLAESTGYSLVVDGNLGCVLPDTTLTIGPALNQNFEIRNANFVSSVSSAISWDTLQGTTFRWVGGSWSYTGASATNFVSWAPTSAVNDAVDFEDNEIWMPVFNVVPPKGAKLPTLTDMETFSEQDGAINNNKFHMLVLNGACAATNAIVINNPPSAPNGMGQNLFDFGLIVAWGADGHGIQEGSGPINTSQNPLGTNTWIGNIAAACPSASPAPFVGMQTFGIGDLVLINSISIDAGGLQYGFYTDATSNGAATENLALIPQIIATRPVQISGSKDRVITPPNW